MLEAMIYVLRTGVPWRDLPDRFGKWSSVYSRWRRWIARGLWAKILSKLVQEARGTTRFADSTHIKLHQDATGPAGGQESQGIGRTKGGLNTKLTVLVGKRPSSAQLGSARTFTLLPGQQVTYLVTSAGWVDPNDILVPPDSDSDSLKIIAHDAVGTLKSLSISPMKIHFHDAFVVSGQLVSSSKDVRVGGLPVTLSCGETVLGRGTTAANGKISIIASLPENTDGLDEDASARMALS